MSATPEVSVVIPTYSRPEPVTRAVRSALAQTVPNIEVIVVVDGPDDDTCAALAAVADDRLRVVPLEVPVDAWRRPLAETQYRACTAECP